MRTIEEVEKEIECQEKAIAEEKKYNENSGELSFMYWQLYELRKELEELKKGC